MRRKYGPLIGLPVNNSASNFAGAAKTAAGDVQEAALLKHISPVAWQHINLYGRYEFRNGPEAININEIVRELAQLPA